MEIAFTILYNSHWFCSCSGCLSWSCPLWWILLNVRIWSFVLTFCCWGLVRSSDRTISVPLCLFYWCRSAIISIHWKSDYMCRRYCLAFQFLCRFTGSFVALNPMQWFRWYFENKLVLFQRNWQHFILKFRELACRLCFIWGWSIHWLLMV